MAEGTDTFAGLAVPLLGESEIKQQTVGNDILTITGKSGQTGDFLVCQTSAGTEKVVFSAAGAATVGSTLTVTDNAVLSSGVSVAKDATLSSGLSVAKDATLTSGLSVGKNATFSSGLSVAQNATFSSGGSFAGVASFSSFPVVLGGTIALASDATSASATNAGLTTKHIVLFGGIAASGGKAARGFTSAGGFTVELTASIGSAATLNWIAFSTGA